MQNRAAIRWIIQLKIVAQLQGPCDFETRASPDSPYVVRATRAFVIAVCAACRASPLLSDAVCKANVLVTLKAEITARRAQIVPLPFHFATHSWSSLSGLRQLSLHCRSFACMTDNPVCSTSGRSEPARFNGGALTGSLAVGRKLQPKRFVRQQVCAAIFSTKHCPC